MIAPFAQASLYAPGATLDPACAPTDTNCGVESTVASSTAGSFPYYAANGSVLSATTTFTILSNGNIGIGTTSPFDLFSVAGNGFFDGNLTTTGSLSASSLSLTAPLAVTSGGTGSTTLTGILKGNGTGSVLSAIPGTDYLAPLSLSATYPLRYSADTFSLAFGTTTTNSWSGTQTFSNPTYSALFTGGNVGIGTTTPSSLLSVQGNSYVSGTSFFGGAITSTSTAALSITGNAATVTTNANLTGPITSVGNATTITNNSVTNAMLAGGITTAKLASANVSQFTNDSGYITSGVTSLSSLATVGTITSGTWSGLFGAVSGANLTNLTAANISAGTAGINISGTAATASSVNFNGGLTTASSPTFTGLTVTGALTAKLNQLTADYTVDSGSASINVGDIVAYINGKAQKAYAATYGTTITADTPFAANAVGSSYESAAKLDATHFVVAYVNNTSSYAEAVVATVSGTTITYGTPVALNGVGSSYISVAALSSTSFVVAYENTSSTRANAVVAIVSGTAITHGTPVVLDSNGSTYGDFSESVAALSSTSFVVVYTYNGAGNNPSAVAATVSGTTITPGTPALFGYGGFPGYESVAALDSTHFVVAYQGASNYANAAIGTVSGTTITPGTSVALNAVASNYTFVAALSPTSFVVASQNTSTTFANATIGTVSGTTITPGTSVALNAVTSQYVSVAALSSTSFVVAYRDTTNSSYLGAVASTVSGTTITGGTAADINLVNSPYGSVVALSSGLFVTAYTGVSGYTSAVVGSLNTIQAASTNNLGMATNAASANGTVTVASNGIVSGLTGLTAGSTYYWSSGTGLTTISQTYKVGIALTTTSILLNSSNGAGSDQFFGDAVFANNFRITEAAGNPNGLIFKNQLGRQIMQIDENGNLDLSGAFNGMLGIDTISSLFTTSSATSTLSTSSGQAASSTVSWWSANTFLSPLFGSIAAWFADVGNGIQTIVTNVLQAHVGNFSDKLCVGDTCVTPAQFQAMVAGAHQSETGAGGDTSQSGGVTSGSDTTASTTVTTNDTTISSTITTTTASSTTATTSAPAILTTASTTASN